MFVLAAKKNVLELRQKEPLTSGSVNVYRVCFTFSDEWGGLAKVATFRTRGESWSQLLTETDECNIPWEALQAPSMDLACGVYGARDGDIVLPTVWCSLGRILPGASPGDASRPPPRQVSMIRSCRRQMRR